MDFHDTEVMAEFQKRVCVGCRYADEKLTGTGSYNCTKTGGARVREDGSGCDSREEG